MDSTDRILAVTEELDAEEQRLEILKRHTAMHIASLAAAEKEKMFDKLKDRLNDITDFMNAQRIDTVKDSVMDLSLIRNESEKLFGSFAPQEQSQVPQSKQLSFLIYSQPIAEPSPRTEKPAQVKERRAVEHELELLDL